MTDRPSPHRSHVKSSGTLPDVAALLIGLGICCGLCGTNRVGALNMLGAIPLVTLLPGSLLVLALDPLGRSTRGIERWLWSVGASLGLAIVGGFILNVFGGLSRFSFLAYLATVSLLCGVVSGVENLREYRTDRRSDSTIVPSFSPHDLERRTFGEDRDADISRRSKEVRIPSNVADEDHTSERTRWRPRIRLVSSVLVLITGAMLVAAFALSEWSQSTALREDFVQFWLSPQSSAPSGQGEELQLGVENHEGISESYTVSLHPNRGQQSEEWRIRLAPNQVWRKRISLTAGSSAYATLAVSRIRVRSYA